MYISFSLLGIGNAIMQTSINPLVTMLVKGHLATMRKIIESGLFYRQIIALVRQLHHL